MENTCWDLQTKNTIGQISIADRKVTELISDETVFMLHFSPDAKSFLYATQEPGEIVFYRQGWQDGKLIGNPEVVLKLPFAFAFNFRAMRTISLRICPPLYLSNLRGKPIFTC